jgi:hypothetical protein
MGGTISDRPSADEANYLRMMPGAAVEPVAKPSAHGRSEIVPAMSRLLTPDGNVQATPANRAIEPGIELRP